MSWEEARGGGQERRLGEEARRGGLGRRQRKRPGEEMVRMLRSRNTAALRALIAASAVGGPVILLPAASTLPNGHLVMRSKRRPNLILHKGIITSQAGRKALSADYTKAYVGCEKFWLLFPLLLLTD